MIRNNLRDHALNGNEQISKLFETNEEITAMMKPFTQEFRDTYMEGYEQYVNGDWPKARVKFEESIAYLTGSGVEDPLSRRHLDYIRLNNFIPPSHWNGQRKIDE